LGLGLGAFGFQEVWVERAESGAPSLAFAGRAAELSDAAGVQRWHISLTHSDLVAVAYVVAE
jgi:holo-[acyl-carrier protein] synthase